jgi:hypothetical protein
LADLRVDTAQLRAAAGDLCSVAELATAAGDRSSRVAALVPELGAEQAVQAAAEFLSCWQYGLRCVAKQAEQAGHDLGTAAVAYEAAEASLTVAVGGSSAPVAAGWTAPHVPDPVPVRWRASAVLSPPVQLSAATHVSQLIPGEPADSERLGRMLVAFADDGQEARARLGRVGLGGWVGAAAAATEAELTELNRRLGAAESAFDDAGHAVSRYAAVHAEARARAAEALRMYQSAVPASAAAHGALAASVVGAPVEDPDGTLARAGAILAAAREDLDAAARILAKALEEAQKSAPSEPGFLAGLKHAIKSMAEGAFESFAELGPAAVGLVELAAKLDPARAIYDPHGYAAAQDSFFSGIAHTLQHPGKFIAAVTDWDTMHTDPAKWIGKLLPDLLFLGPAMAKEGALRGAESEERLATAQEAVEEAERTGALNKISDADAADQRLAELGLRTDGIAGVAGRDQLLELSNPDEWMPTRLHEGDLIAVADHGKIIVRISGEMTSDGREFYEAIQKAPRRFSGPEGVPSSPELPPDVTIYRLGGDMDAASATASANSQFGAGGGTLLSVGEFDDAVDSGRLIPAGEHTFSPDTLISNYEDPRYRHVDPTLPTHALDPDFEEIRGRWAEAAKHARDNVRNATLVAAEEVSNEHAERGAR